MVSVNKRNLLSLLVNNKEKSNTLEKNGVYEIHCAKWDAIYIGQCGRALKHRISEHKKAILTNTSNTGFADHCLQHNNFIDTKNITLIQMCIRDRHNTDVPDTP